MALRKMISAIRFMFFSIFGPKSARMKTSLEHLPKEKQDRIMYITNAIVERIQPEKVILYGSYATGKWVEDSYIEDGIEYEYISDYDLLVITRTDDTRSEGEIQNIAEKRIGNKEEVSVIAHNIDYVNGKLARGQYFFSDIQREGILLYDAGKVPLAQRRQLTAFEKKEIAQNDFDNWISLAKSALKGGKFYVENNEFRDAAFILHQCAERAYNTVILVFRGYKPKTHNLDKLRRYAKHWSKDLTMIFPKNSPTEIALFNKLKEGYVGARYDKDYSITETQLQEFIVRLEKLLSIVERICSEKISAMG